MEQDFEAMSDGSLHTARMFDEESLAHGGEAINPATGKPNINHQSSPTEGLSEREDTGNGEDMMGDLPDPSKMSLAELIRTQKD